LLWACSALDVLLASNGSGNITELTGERVKYIVQGKHTNQLSPTAHDGHTPYAGVAHMPKCHLQRARVTDEQRIARHDVFYFEGTGIGLLRNNGYDDVSIGENSDYFQVSVRRRRFHYDKKADMPLSHEPRCDTKVVPRSGRDDVALANTSHIHSFSARKPLPSVRGGIAVREAHLVA